MAAPKAVVSYQLSVHAVACQLTMLCRKASRRLGHRAAWRPVGAQYCSLGRKPQVLGTASRNRPVGAQGRLEQTILRAYSALPHARRLPGAGAPGCIPAPLQGARRRDAASCAGRFYRALPVAGGALPLLPALAPCRAGGTAWRPPWRAPLLVTLDSLPVESVVRRAQGVQCGEGPDG